MKKKLVLLGAATLLSAATASAQSRVTGRVTDSHGEPVMGATVRIPGTKIVTTTDAKGNFKLQNVPASAKKIVVSYIGMQATTVSVAGNVDVVLKENELGEAVVIGYGTARKIGTVVGSVKKVGSEQVSDKPVANVADALQGKVAGLQIASNSGDAGEMGDMSIRLRGVGSLGAGNEPLVVIDGAPASSSALAMLNDRDIESITTLKDASATSIYGSRASNGVIYVTTKRGRSNEQARITVAQRVGWSQLANGIGNPMNATELLQFQLENGIIQADKYEEYKLHGANTNWQKYFFDNSAPMYTTDFSMQGGSGNTTYFVSASYLKQKSLTRVSHFDRYTVRTNLDTKPKEWLAFGIKQSIAYTDRRSDEWTNSSEDFRNSAQNSMVSSYMYPAYWDPYDPEYREEHKIYGGNLYDFQYLQRLRPSQTNDVVYSGVAYAQITPLKGLTVKSQLGLYAADSRTSQYMYQSMPGAETGWAYEGHGRSAQWTITNTAEYKFDIQNDHHVILLAGQEGIKSTYKAFGIQGTGTTDDRLPTLGNVTEGKVPSYSSYTNEYLSFFGRADYNYKEKYYANFTVRNDQCSRFGSKNRSANFYSGGLMWNIISEDFMAETRGWLSALQLKVSVGSTGNSSIGNYESLGLIGTTQYLGQSGWLLSQPANEELGWETQIQTNVGVMARFYDRVNLDVNFYHKKTKDMLMGVPLPHTTGFASQTMNIGSMSNKGVEIEVSVDALRTRDAYVTLYANYAYNTNKTDELFYGYQEGPMLNYLLNYVVGESLNYYMPIYAGVDKNDGAPMWYKVGHSGKPGHEYNPETMTKTYSDDLYQNTGKQRFTPHSGGFGLAASWKGFTLNADFSFMLGKYMVNNDYFLAASSGNAKNGLNQDRDMLNIWKKPGDLAELPGFQYDVQFDTHVLENASYMRLKNLSLSYDLPQNWMRATRFFQNVRLNATARNLWTVTNYRGADPELDSNLALGNYPSTRQFTLGVEVTF